MSLKSEKQLNVIVILIHVSVFLYYKASVILFFGHHFRDLLIPTFMVVTIFILIGIISFNHILLCLASFDFYCGSFAVNRVAVLVASGAVQAIQHILWTQLFLAIFLNGIFARKKLFFSTLESHVQ